MSTTDLWGVLMALMVIVAPLWLAWVLLARSERRKDRRSPAPAPSPAGGSSAHAGHDNRDPP